MDTFIKFCVCILTFICALTTNAQSTKLIDDKKALQYCVDPDWMPYEAIRNDVHVGISYDYLATIAENSGFSFVLLRTENWNQSLAMAATGECHFLAMLNKTPVREDFLVFTNSYFTAPNVLVAQTGSSILHGYESITEQVLGVVRGYRHEEYLRRYYPHISTISFETERESLRALSMGKVDLSVGSLLAVNSHIQQEGFDNIQVIGLAQPHDQLRIGVSRNIDSDLLDGVSVEDVVTRINKAIAMIPESSHVDIFRQWNNVKYVENTDYKIFVWPTLIMAVFAIMLAWRARSVSSLNDSLAESNAELEKLQEQLVEKNRNLAFLSIHDSLTGLFNRNFILQRAEEAVNAFERFKQPVCLIVMDVDHFKRINEKYGHSTGDRLLKVIAEASSRSLREVDLIARWGGEEFLILCPYSDSEAAIVLVERIQQAMQDVKLGIPERITCSFGIAELRTGEDFSTWFDNADKSMYRAKQAGRNQLSVYKDKF